jgi:folate-binding protein YgfZ
VSEPWRIDGDFPALLAFRGTDALRFLNGQLTQDARLVVEGPRALPSCITDAKGHLQFRVWLTTGPDGSLWVEDTADRAAELEARLTRYLVADDVEVLPLTGQWMRVHFTGSSPAAPEGVLSRACVRYGQPGVDWWIPAGMDVRMPPDIPLLAGDALEDFRIARGIPAWARELNDSVLPPEAGLDESDISYHKGCYIGQEILSRLKRSGRLNKRLARLQLDATATAWNPQLLDAEGKEAGTLTSISPLMHETGRAALGLVKRGAAHVFTTDEAGIRHPARIL